MKFQRNPLEYRRHLPHIEKPGWPHFVTFHTAGQLHLSQAARDLVMQH
jgi:hypothetical protein